MAAHIVFFVCFFLYAHPPPYPIREVLGSAPMFYYFFETLLSVVEIIGTYRRVKKFTKYSLNLGHSSTTITTYIGDDSKLLMIYTHIVNSYSVGKDKISSKGSAT